MSRNEATAGEDGLTKVELVRYFVGLTGMWSYDFTAGQALLLLLGKSGFLRIISGLAFLACLFGSWPGME
jgi:hypothetical protein